MDAFMGIDIGSVKSKGVIINNGSLITYHVVPSGTDYRSTSQELKRELLAKACLSQEEIACIAATGSGAFSVEFASNKVDDIISCARGINNIFPSARTVIDMGGQASRVIRLDSEGQVANFVVSEKCASGSGRFLEVIANVLRIDLADVGPLSLGSRNPVAFTTGCAVFGETEAITRVSEGVCKEDILAGVHESLANKVSSLVHNVGLEQPCAVSGGPGLDIGLIKSIEDKLQLRMLAPPQPQIITALGAALEAARKLEAEGRELR